MPLSSVSSTIGSLSLTTSRSLKQDLPRGVDVRLGQVIGHVVSTQKNDRLIGAKLLLVQPVAADGTAAGQAVLAVDAAQAGIGERVLLVIEGRAAISASGPPRRSRRRGDRWCSRPG